MLARFHCIARGLSIIFVRHPSSISLLVTTSPSRRVDPLVSARNTSVEGRNVSTSSSFIEISTVMEITDQEKLHYPPSVFQSSSDEPPNVCSNSIAIAV